MNLAFLLSKLELKQQTEAHLAIAYAVCTAHVLDGCPVELQHVREHHAYAEVDFVTLAHAVVQIT